MANNAFAGGYTHGNRYLVNTTLIGDIGHFDYKSHYPSREELDYMPSSKFVIYYDEELEDDKMTRRELNQLCKEKCVFMTVALYDVTIKKGITAPMLSVSGAHNVNYKFKADNGRILKIFGDIPAIYTFTELDYKWLRKQYKYKMTIIKVATAKRGRCPEPIREVTNKYFEIKETLSEGYYYMKSKNKLNAIYGCSATNPVRAKIDWNLDTGLWKITNKDDDTSIQEALDKYYGSRNNFMPYQIGVYTTAHARDKLFTIIEKIVGYENFIYADTDSIFCYVTDEIKAKIEKYNKDIIRLNKKFNLGVKNKKEAFLITERSKMSMMISNNFVSFIVNATRLPTISGYIVPLPESLRTIDFRRNIRTS